jgi:surface antigen
MIAVLLMSCSQNGEPDSVFNKQNLGALLGGATGAFVGSRIGGGTGKVIATAVGGVAGALLGGQIGKTLDDADKQLITSTTHQALETAPPYESAHWRNPETGHHGDINAGPIYEQNGQNCRPFTQTIFVDGKTQTARGQACKQNDGTWNIVS